MKDKQILFIIHRLYSNNLAKKGGIDRILEFLAQKNKITTIEHPFEKINHPSVFTPYQNTLKADTGFTANNLIYRHQSFLKIPFVWIEEFIMNIIWVLKNHVRCNLVIASDPLNFFSCYVIKILRKTDKIQFHSTDYSSPRFNNPIFENIYQWLYRFALKKADIVTVVSQRMHDHATIALGGKQSNIFLLPNSPDFEAIPKIPIHKRNRKELVMSVGIFRDQVDINKLVENLKAIKKLHTDFLLTIIGFVDKKYIDVFVSHGLKDNVRFLGLVEYNKAVDIISHASIGITCYSPHKSYVYYADSLKIREYAAAGLPIVCDAIYGTAQEMKEYNAGFVYNSAQEMVTSVHQLMSNKELYQTISEYALFWAKKMDKRKLLAELYGKSV